jgi:hydroxyethylthiazole kinase
MPAEESEMRPLRAPAVEGAGHDLPSEAGRLLDALRQERTRVHAITNAAAQVLTANLLLAAGGTPSLTAASDEVSAFAGRAGALLVNLGTLDAERRAAIPTAVEAARAAGRPWVLDPVFVDASPPRLAFARDLLRERPAILRCNGDEFAALAERPAEPAAVAAFARAHGVVAVTGETDLITDGKRRFAVANGHPLMGRVTAVGCAGAALLAAFAALEPDALTAAAAASLVVGVAGEIAGERASGPGSFPVAFLDALHALDGRTLAIRARVS